MKKYLVFMTLSFAMTLTSCVAQNLSKQIESSLGEKLYLNIKGNIFIKSSSENTLLLLFRSDGVSGNSFDKAFTIFSETEIAKLSLSETDDYEIKIPENKKFAVIYNLTKNKIHFIGTSDKSSDIGVIKQNSSISKAVSNLDYLGYGFSYMNGMWSVNDIKESKYKQPFNTLDYANTANPQLRVALPPDDDGGGVSCAQGTCTSGGAGSSSCSITEVGGLSCTVSCNSGYYACCVSSTTRCYCCKIQ